MTPYDMIRSHLDNAVPFAAHVGVKLLEIGDGTARAELVQRHETSNHIGTQHAGAMSTLGEAASGAAMAGAIAPVIMDMRPVAAMGQITFKRIAEGTLTAHAKTAQPGTELLQTLQKDGRVAFDVAVDIQNDAGETVVEMSVNWHISAKR